MNVHKELISRQDLKVGSGYAINYTNMIMNSALKWYETETKKGEN